MYKRGAVLLVLINFIILTACFSVKGISINRNAAKKAFCVQSMQEEGREDKINIHGSVIDNSSTPRVVKVNVIEKECVVECSHTDYENLLRIVEAEAGGEDKTGKQLVANVIINRVQNDKFPSTITDVIYQKDKGVTQFSPITDGRFETVKVSEETKEAVECALMGEDISSGALYFVARKYADVQKMAWFDKNLIRLFKYGGHEFFL